MVKYYVVYPESMRRAGSQRLAMRTGGSANANLTWLFGDHPSTSLRTSLSSTSVTTDLDGDVISRTLYKPLPCTQGRLWGGRKRHFRVRYQSGTLPTQYILPCTQDRLYTGQYSHTADFGLMYYNARWYDPYLNRFIQPDSIVPDPKNPVAWDRYAYSANNPVKYNDPSGHCWGAFSWVRSLPSYGTTCNNLDMALVIVTSPDTTVGEKVVAGAYIVGEGVAHGTAAVYGGITVCGAASAACYQAATAGTAACADGDCTNEVVAVQQTAQSVWNLNPFDRGIAIENILGRSPQLAQNFPVIDRFLNGVATSIKSIDLMAKSYQNITTLTRTVQGYVNTLANWQGASWGGVTIQANQIVGRELLLAVPPNATAAQLQALQQLQQWALNQGVTLTLTTVK